MTAPHSCPPTCIGGCGCCCAIGVPCCAVLYCAVVRSTLAVPHSCHATCTLKVGLGIAHSLVNCVLKCAGQWVLFGLDWDEHSPVCLGSTLTVHAAAVCALLPWCRVGRTARAGAKGRALTFIEDGDRALLKEVGASRAGGVLQVTSGCCG